jgi:hypothetical protein
MDFSDALRAVKDGRRVRRALWRELDGRAGTWMELVPTDQVPDGAVVMVLFACGEWDILAEDWEELRDTPATAEQADTGTSRQ